jgi:hypothetical protein
MLNFSELASEVGLQTQTISDCTVINLSTVYFILPWDSGHTWSFDAFQDIKYIYSSSLQSSWATNKDKTFLYCKISAPFSTSFYFIFFYLQYVIDDNCHVVWRFNYFHHYSPKENKRYREHFFLLVSFEAVNRLKVSPRCFCFTAHPFISAPY